MRINRGQNNTENLANKIKYDYNLSDMSDREEIKAFESVVGNRNWEEYCWAKGYYIGKKDSYRVKGVKRTDKEGHDYWTADEDYQQDEIRYKYLQVLRNKRKFAQEINEPPPIEMTQQEVQF